MTVTLNGPMEGKSRFSGLPGGTALQGRGVGHYHCVMYNAKQGTDFTVVQRYILSHRQLRTPHTPTTTSA